MNVFALAASADSAELTFADRATTALIVSLQGMLTIFLVLSILWGAIELLHLALGREKKAKPVKTAPVAEAAPAPVAEPAPAEETDPDGTVKFAAGQKQTLEEKYLELSPEARGWYDEIMKHAAMVEGSKRVKNVRYEEYKLGNNRLVRMLIKRGVINCEFILHNQNFKNYVSENKISVKQSATTMLIESKETVEAAKNSIDIVVAQIAEEREYKKQLAREKRKAAKEASEASAQ